MEVILSSGSVHTLPVEQQFELAKEAGFQGMELVINRHFRPATVSRLAQLSDAFEVPIRNLHSPFEPVPGWGTQPETIMRTADVGRALGAASITFHPPQRAMEDVLFQRWLGEVQDFQAEVGKGEIAITVENMPRMRVWRGMKVPFATTPYRYQNRDELWELLEERNLFMTFDTTHFGTTKESLPAAFAQFRDRVKVVHLSNFRNRDFQEHLPADQGDLELAPFVRRLHNLGYQGLLTLEVFPAFIECHPKGFSGALHDFMRWLEQAWQDRLSPRPSSLEPA
jgi:sugar phosphate isomerase/epimerase